MLNGDAFWIWSPVAVKFVGFWIWNPYFITRILVSTFVLFSSLCHFILHMLLTCNW
jgi:hypothetical protein